MRRKLIDWERKGHFKVLALPLITRISLLVVFEVVTCWLMFKTCNTDDTTAT